ncbi:MAG: helix-turn-helix domain-containing protein [Defluviitaleaceae bacterium]|nr:helix-turn-helix domain-containing protein [Defluviitaleaceae bacterium]
MNEKIGQRIRELRLYYNLSIEELSDLLGISSGFLRLVERGERGATIERLAKISKIFNVSMDYLALGRETDLTKNDNSPVKFLERILTEHELHKIAEFGKGLSTFNYSAEELDLLFVSIHSQLKFLHNIKSRKNSG